MTRHYHNKIEIESLKERFARIAKADDRSLVAMYHNINGFDLVWISYDWELMQWTCIGYPQKGPDYVFCEMHTHFK